MVNGGVADGGRWARVLEPAGGKRVARGAVGDMAGGVVPFIGPEAREQRRSGRQSVGSSVGGR
jgi:hypothetical protein